MLTLSTFALSTCAIASSLLATQESPPTPPTTTVVATLSVIDLELGVPFNWELRAERLADGATITYSLHGTSSGSVAVPMQAAVTLKSVETRAANVRPVPLPSGGFSLRAADAEVVTVTVTAGDANAATYTVVRDGITALRATTDATRWAMADRSAPSLASVLAMISVAPGADDGAEPENGNVAVAACHPTFRECVSAATTACAPGKPIVSYSCDELGQVATCSWDCGPAPMGP